MTDPMSIAAAKVPTVPVPPAGPAAARAQAVLDTAWARNGEADGANGSHKAQEGALSQILRDAPKAQKAAAQHRPDGQRPDQQKEKEANPLERTVAAVEDAVRTLRDYLGGLPSEMKFDYDEEAGRQVFKVINPVTHEVVRQYPPEEFLAMVKRLKELAENADDNGMLFDDRY